MQYIKDCELLGTVNYGALTRYIGYATIHGLTLMVRNALLRLERGHSHASSLIKYAHLPSTE